VEEERCPGWLKGLCDPNPTASLYKITCEVCAVDFTAQTHETLLTCREAHYKFSDKCREGGGLKGVEEVEGGSLLNTGDASGVRSISPALKEGVKSIGSSRKSLWVTNEKAGAEEKE
jgi:hypothetical protein